MHLRENLFFVLLAVTATADGQSCNFSVSVDSYRTLASNFKTTVDSACTFDACGELQTQEHVASMLQTSVEISAELSMPRQNSDVEAHSSGFRSEQRSGVRVATATRNMEAPWWMFLVSLSFAIAIILLALCIPRHDDKAVDLHPHEFPHVSCPEFSQGVRDSPPAFGGPAQDHLQRAHGRFPQHVEEYYDAATTETSEGTPPNQCLREVSGRPMVNCGTWMRPYPPGAYPSSGSFPVVKTAPIGQSSVLVLPPKEYGYIRRSMRDVGEDTIQRDTSGGRWQTQENALRDQRQSLGKNLTNTIASISLLSSHAPPSPDILTGAFPISPDRYMQGDEDEDEDMIERETSSARRQAQENTLREQRLRLGESLADTMASLRLSPSRVELSS